MKKLPSIVNVNINDLNYNPEYDNFDDLLSDYLSDTYGFCHYGFDYETDIISGDIKIFDIEWDTSE